MLDVARRQLAAAEGNHVAAGGAAAEVDAAFETFDPPIRCGTLLPSSRMHVPLREPLRQLASRTAGCDALQGRQQAPEEVQGDAMTSRSPAVGCFPGSGPTHRRSMLCAQQHAGWRQEGTTACSQDRSCRPHLPG